MDVIKPLRGLGLLDYPPPGISCGAIEIEALWASQLQAQLLSQAHVIQTDYF